MNAMAEGLSDDDLAHAGRCGRQAAGAGPGAESRPGPDGGGEGARRQAPVRLLPRGGSRRPGPDPASSAPSARDTCWRPCAPTSRAPRAGYDPAMNEVAQGLSEDDITALSYYLAHAERPSRSREVETSRGSRQGSRFWPWSFGEADLGAPPRTPPKGGPPFGIPGSDQSEDPQGKAGRGAGGEHVGTPSLKRNRASIAASAAPGRRARDRGSTRPAGRAAGARGGPRVARRTACAWANQTARLRITPTTAAVMAASAPESARLPRRRST